MVKPLKNYSYEKMCQQVVVETPQIEATASTTNVPQPNAWATASTASGQQPTSWANLLFTKQKQNSQVFYYVCCFVGQECMGFFLGVFVSRGILSIDYDKDYIFYLLNSQYPPSIICKFMFISHR